MEPLQAHWEAIAGNHDRNIAELRGHRALDLGPLVLALLDTAEEPSFSLHALVGASIVSHVVPVGGAAVRTSISPGAAPFVEWARGTNATRPTAFS